MKAATWQLTLSLLNMLLFVNMHAQPCKRTHDAMTQTLQLNVNCLLDTHMAAGHGIQCVSLRPEKVEKQRLRYYWSDSGSQLLFKIKCHVCSHVGKVSCWLTRNIFNLQIDIPAGRPI